MGGGREIYAIVETGGKQHRVTEGQTVDVERLKVAEGDTVELDRVLLIADGDKVTVGTPTIEGAEIAGVATTAGTGKHAYASFDPSLYPVSAGEKVGAEIISTGSTGTPTPDETVVTVFVQIGQSQT